MIEPPSSKNAGQHHDPGATTIDDTANQRVEQGGNRKGNEHGRGHGVTAPPELLRHRLQEQRKRGTHNRGHVGHHADDRRDREQYARGSPRYR